MGASDTLAEHRARKEAAAIKFATQQRIRIKRIFDEKHLPGMTRVLTGTCIGLDTAAKTIDVELDPIASDLTLPIERTIIWDRPKIAAGEIVGKRVKVFVTYSQGTQFMLAAIMT